MSVLSITFHTEESAAEEWKNYAENDLQLLVENLMDVDKYIISEVESEMISEGKNTNLLLIFENEDKRKEFIDIEFMNISERIAARFGEKVMIFKTELNPKKTRL